MNLFYSGIDLGSRKIHICIIDENDKRLVDERSAPLGIVSSIYDVATEGSNVPKGESISPKCICCVS